jgi:hypothetical protein
MCTELPAAGYLRSVAGKSVAGKSVAGKFHRTVREAHGAKKASTSAETQNILLRMRGECRGGSFCLADTARQRTSGV